MIPELKDIIKGNKVKFSYYRGGYFHFIVVPSGQEKQFSFPVSAIEADKRSIFIELEMPAQTLFYFIRSAVNEKQFTETSKEKVDAIRD